MMENEKKVIAIIGGGAAGFFAALRCAEYAKEMGVNCKVRIYESGKTYLRKVKISGGGRCNVTHHEFNTVTFCENYPRGKRELRSPFSEFQASDTVDWFKARGVELVHESDGRMFPKTNSSQTIIDCFMREAKEMGIERFLGQRVKSILAKEQGGFLLNGKEHVDALLIATGSDVKGYELIKSLGHQITELAPSLFTFKIKNPLLKDLLGTSFEKITIDISFEGGKKYKQSGPALITHWGMSGPAILKLSAFAAREMKGCSYQAKVSLNWTPYEKIGEVEQNITLIRKNHPQSRVKNHYPNFLSKKFWVQLVGLLNINHEKKWDEVSRKEIQMMVESLFRYQMETSGQSRFKEEFVECGGVNLKEISLKTMESKLVKDLYFAGEVMDVDGITGGFNFQNAWTSGYISGTNLALSCLE